MSEGAFPDCGCHYTTDDDGIHFCDFHKNTEAKVKELLAKVDLLIYGQSYYEVKDGNCDESMSLAGMSGLAALRMDQRQYYQTTCSELQAQVKELQSKPCPHVVTSSEGTSYCALAEHSVNVLEDKVKELTERLEKMEWKKCNAQLQYLEAAGERDELKADNARMREALVYALDHFHGRLNPLHNSPVSIMEEVLKPQTKKDA